MKNKLLTMIFVCSTVLFSSVLAQDEAPTAAQKCEMAMDACSAKCDEIQDDAQRDACLTKCETEYNKCYEEAESK